MSLIDWLIVAIFLLALVVIGYLFSHKNKNIEDYFVAGRSMPGWLVAIAATGTSISAGTFVGSPELGFNTNLTYVMNLLGAIVGGSVVAAFILPRLYNAHTITIYGFIGDRFGTKSKTSTSIMFLLGQLFTSGSRLFIAAIAISVIVFGNIQFQFMVWSIIILGLISTFYTMMGGIKGLLYIDTFQTLLMIFTGIVGLVLVAISLGDLSWTDIWHMLTDGGMVKNPAAAGVAPGLAADGSIQGWTEGSKIQILDFSLDFSKPYTVLGGLIGVAVFKIAMFTTDQEFVQRQLACQDVKKAGRSLVASQLLSLPTVLIFLLIGSLLFVKYKMANLALILMFALFAFLSVKNSSWHEMNLYAPTIFLLCLTLIENFTYSLNRIINCSLNNISNLTLTILFAIVVKNGINRINHLSYSDSTLSVATLVVPVKTVLKSIPNHYSLFLRENSLEGKSLNYVHFLLDFC